jgi:hypothetical protein
LREKQRELELAAVRKPLEEEPVPANDTGNAAPVAAPAAELNVQNVIADDARVDVPDAFENAAPPEIEQHWHTFWNPFRSEIAARGFVSQLERVTGLDYRVIKVKSGVYEVAFAYESDADRQKRLSQIQAATGLDLPGS